MHLLTSLRKSGRKINVGKLQLHFQKTKTQSGKTSLFALFCSLDMRSMKLSF